MWYDSASGALKTVMSSAAWSSSSPLSTVRQYLGGAGNQTAGLAAGGNVPPHTNATE